MRYEDREIDRKLDGVELNVEQERDSELVERDDRKLPDHRLPELYDATTELRIAQAMQAILEGSRQVVVADLSLPKHVLDGLDALKAAATGKDARLSRFVFAEDRRELLEEALAILQPSIAVNRGEFAGIVEQIACLRAELRDLKDAERDARHELPMVTRTDGDDTTDDDDDDDDDDQASQNDAEPTSTLFDGPEATHEPATSTLTAGPEVMREPVKSTLFDGPAAPDRVAAPTTLGDPNDIEAMQPKRPWWKLGKS